MRFYSRIYTGKLIAAFILGLWCLILIFVTINNAMGCTDKNGCRKNLCTYRKLKDEYKNLLNKNCLITNFKLHLDK